MTIDLLGQVRGFAGAALGCDGVRLAVRPLHGGLEASAVLAVCAARPRLAEAIGRPRSLSFVVKHLRGAQVREAAIYAALDQSSLGALAPRWLGTVPLEDGSLLLFLEHVRAGEVWPWRRTGATAAVLTRLATLHRHPTVIPAWDYDTVLEREARLALATLETAPRALLPLPVLRLRPVLRRVVLALPGLRRQLAGGRFGRRLIHGDVHSQNVVWGWAGRVVLLDWGRARTGSALEDVSSWLESLGLWEPEARRRHDTLLVHYLAETGGPARLTDPVRGEYWLAAASNVLSGALGHHLGGALAAARAGGPPSAVAERWRPVHTWSRILRRADAVSSA